VVRGGRGRKPGISPEKVQEIVRLTQHEKPSGATHWSCWSTKNRSGTTTSDYRRQATTTLFAALNALDGTMIGSWVDEHRLEEFLGFLRTVDRQVPKGLAVHMMLDNHATHRHQDVLAWLVKHRWFRLHNTATFSSWLNLVERWFGS
jgi:hypothetical protein